MASAITPILGIKLGVIGATNVHGIALGTTVQGDDGHTWVFVKASEAVTSTCTVSTDGNFTLTDAAGNYTAPAAFASGDYGWVKVTALTA